MHPNAEPTYSCEWPYRALAVLCDGKVVCGCGDPRGRNVLGHLDEQGILEVWHNSQELQQIRIGLEQNRPHRYCRGCSLLEAGGSSSAGSGAPLPSGPLLIHIEPTILCNLSCANDCCSRESGIRETRRSMYLSEEHFQRIIDTAGPALERIDFYNYGEPFLHSKVSEMIVQAKEKYPRLYTSTSTNGLPLDNDDIRRDVVLSGLDQIFFSIDGVDQETYERYRRGGSYEKVMNNLRSLVELRERLGKNHPYIIWRYILFRWNDSDDQLEAAERLAEELGVDRFCYEITDYPEEAYSLKYRPGTEAFEKIKPRVWGWARFGMRRRIIDFRIPRTVRRGTPFQVRLTVENSGENIWRRATPFGRRHVTAGIHLVGRKGEVIERDFGRGMLDRDIRSGEKAEITIEATAPLKRGLYKLVPDMVYEGVCWFSELEEDRKSPQAASIMVW